MDVENITKNFTQSLSSGPFNDLFTNPVYVSILITASVMLITICIFNESKLVKTSFYIMCINLFIIFIHNKLLLIEHRKQLCNKDTENICNTIGAGPIHTQSANSASGLDYLSM